MDAYPFFFMLIFAALVMAYGLLLHVSGNKELIPYRVSHSIRGKEDAKRVGLVTFRVGLVLALAIGVAFAILSLWVK